MNRTQTVVLDGQESALEFLKVLLSLGPLLFLVLIGDIDKEVFEAFLSSFADDT